MLADSPYKYHWVVYKIEWGCFKNKKTYAGANIVIVVITESNILIFLYMNLRKKLSI